MIETVQQHLELELSSFDKQAVSKKSQITNALNSGLIHRLFTTVRLIVLATVIIIINHLLPCVIHTKSERGISLNTYELDQN